MIVCAGKSFYLLARDFSGPDALNGREGLMDTNRAAVNSLSAAYRVLRGGRQQPWRSVDREVTGRNESEAIELRQILEECGCRDCMTKSKAICVSLRAAIHRSPSARHIIKADRETQEIHRVGDEKSSSQLARMIFKEPMWPSMEVRSFHSSEEVR